MPFRCRQIIEFNLNIQITFSKKSVIILYLAGKNYDEATMAQLRQMEKEVCIQVAFSVYFPTKNVVVAKKNCPSNLFSCVSMC